MFTAITERLLAAVAPTVEAQAYTFCSYGSEVCRNHQRYIWQTCFSCANDRPGLCIKTSQSLVDYGGC